MPEDTSMRMTPKVIFIAGLVFGLLIAGTAGFIWILTGGALPTGSAANPPAVVTNTPTTNQPTAVNIAPVTAADHIRGDINAKIKIVEYSDTECPYCKQFHPTLQQISQTYGDQVAWVYRHFPIASLHPKAAKESEATECVAELGGEAKFWQYLDKIYEVTPSNNGLDAAQLPILAQQVGVDKAKFETCLSSGKYTAKIQQAVAAAQEAGAQGTPYSVVLVGDQKLPVEGAVTFEQFKSALDSLLAS